VAFYDNGQLMNYDREGVTYDEAVARANEILGVDDDQ